MKMVIKLILIYLGIQFICGGLIGIFFIIIVCMNGGSVDVIWVLELILVFLMLFFMVVMFFYLWKVYYIFKDKISWLFILFLFLIIMFLIGLLMIVLMDLLIVVLFWVFDILEQQFDVFQFGWLGIVVIILLGLIFEEFLFCGGVIKVLFECYFFWKVIFFLVLFFGVFYLNLVQIVVVFFGGFLLVWVYYWI